MNAEELVARMQAWIGRRKNWKVSDQRAFEAIANSIRLSEQVDDAVARLDGLADLLADSTEICVGQTPAIEILNEVLDSLGNRKKPELHGMDKTGEILPR
jgi:hypothetical protein